MKYIILGNGVAGLHAAETIRKQSSKDSTVEIFTDEPYLTYSRPKLPQYIANDISLTDLFLKSENWFDENNIKINLKKKALKIDEKKKVITFEDGFTTNYDKLLIAIGSHSCVLPIKGADHPRVRTLRSIEDANSLMKLAKDCKNVAVIGGGLLGIETANAINSPGKNVTIIEYFPRLLPMQLDVEGAEVLKKLIEDKGIKLILGAATEEIIEVKENLLKIKIKDGREAEADMIVISAGVRPNLEVAKESGINSNRGIIVNEFMETNLPEVWAAGDVAEFENRCWGIIPAAFTQARVAAMNMTSEKKMASGKIIPSNTLKVAGIDLTSIGTVYFEETPKDVTELRVKDMEKGIYKKVVIQDNQVIGAIWLGDRKNILEITKIIKNKINVEKFKDDLLKEEFDLKKYT